uniref:Uncharacterized protein n=1 Tax=Parascaris univalens TaxID=6257 RepID=A0A915AVL3_PARUN
MLQFVSINVFKGGPKGGGLSQKLANGTRRSCVLCLIRIYHPRISLDVGLLAPSTSV